jgi:hypothetical protein
MKKIVFPVIKAKNNQIIYLLQIINSSIFLHAFKIFSRKPIKKIKKIEKLNLKLHLHQSLKLRKKFR